MKALIKKLIESTGYRIGKIPEKPSHLHYDQDGLKTAHSNAFMDEAAFQEAFDRGEKALAGSETYQIHWRLHIALWAASHAKRLGGDFVECGVNRGFVSSAVMEYLDWNNMDAHFYLLDTFGGIDAELLTDEEADSDYAKHSEERIERGFYTTDVDAVKANFSEWERAHVVQGRVPETLEAIESEAISYLHLDMNCSAPEVATMEHLWDRIKVGGIILMDDYVYWGFESIRKGADDFAKSKGHLIAALPTGQGILIKGN